MSHLHRITIDPTICNGTPVITGTHYPVALIIDLLRSGLTPTELLTDHPTLTRPDLVAALRRHRPRPHKGPHQFPHTRT
ncbi:DUF433 domain-containing protein [Nocardia yunnanensis]|uniref:DUF433 domain-containing protein n=1 Tax=Nocardia yunnanensis TaxID=2382165 RepID=A0A386Z9F9_9NOCA|nr:DUF433 domain-containing protein [Nocardia yunnanensis]AYF73235.1 DUF433 domain-containing protein [Nocardia yunnanensis]